MPALQLQCLSVPRVQFLGQDFDRFLEILVAHVFNRCDTKVTAELDRRTMRRRVGDIDIPATTGVARGCRGC
jgi:hypothetical protein